MELNTRSLVKPAGACSSGGYAAVWAISTSAPIATTIDATISRAAIPMVRAMNFRMADIVEAKLRFVVGLVLDEAMLK